jgi:hypothetical protein
MTTTTMPKPRASTASREPIALSALLDKLQNIEHDLRDITAELTALNAAHYLPVPVQPSVQSAYRQSGFAADHVGAALLVLRSKQEGQGNG